MDLLQLKYFCEIAREEHITRAARNLNIAQPALSASLNRLEKELGVSLFDRVGRNICLNSCGQAFYQYISPALLLIENGERAMEDFRAPETNTLMLGSINQSLLQEAILAYRKKYPDIRISQLTIDPQDAEQEMKRNYFDFLILPQRLSMPGVIQDTLVEERFMIAINREHPLASEKELSLEQLKDEPFICLPQGYSFRKFTDSICEKAGFKPHVVMECFHCQMLDLIAADAGSALPTLERAVKSGHFRVMDALTGLSLHRVPAGSPLLNLNTPEQVRAFRDQYFRLDLDTALERILGAVPGTAGAEILPLNQCAGRFLAQDFSAPMDNPPFDRSALDGYAVRSQDIRSASPDAPVRLRVVGSALAGHPSPAAVEEGCALRIMTGAVMPAGSDCVIRQEDTDCGEETVSIFQAVGAGKNYARRGEDIAEGSLLLSAGQKITPAEMGILASMGVTDIPVSARPRVALLSTGDELALPGQPLKPGCIYNSSLCLLAARLRELGTEPTVIELLRDDPAAAALRIRNIALQGAADLILTTGGVSVGQKDIFHQVVPMSGGELIFWRLKIKPGSPVMFWKLGETPILSLSGNPFAAYATFELLARPALGKLLGTASLALRRAQAVLASPFEKSGGLRRFLRGTYAGGQVFLPENHSSGSLQSLKGCNCLVDIPAGSPPLSPGDRVTILAEDWLLPPQKEGGR